MKKKYFFKLSSLNSIIVILFVFVTTISFGQIKVYNFTLDGASESPPNSSTGTGTATITVNVSANTMRVQSTFSGLAGNTTTCHVHAATTTANTGTAGVATQTPAFSGFPLGVTSGTYDTTFDMTLSASYNSAYITANGGTTATAFTALIAAFDASKAYFNIHSSTFGGGEIRGFSSPVLANESFDLNSKVLVYPNPVTKNLTITNDSDSKIEVYDVMGKIVVTKNMSAGDSDIEMSNYSKGVYLAKITNTNNQSKIVKIIKQ